MKNWLRMGPLSPELVCFHEAGHIATAHAIGASVERVELYSEPHPHARTSVKRNQYQAVFIACGGFAAEHSLFFSNRLFTAAGVPMTEVQFLDEALKNAEKDLDSFRDAALTVGLRVNDLPREFIQTAVSHVAPEINFEIVQQLATALLEKKKLEKRDICTIAGRRFGWLSSITGEYRLQRMNGYEGSELALMTAKALCRRR